MSYEKQVWSKYDALKPEEENIENGAVVTDSRMNHMENGISDSSSTVENHVANKLNPHSVTKTQVGLGNVDNIEQAAKSDFDAHVSNTSNPHEVTKSQIGLDKVVNVEQASKSNFDSHVSNYNNPHAVTASQTGAYTKGEVVTLISEAIKQSKLDANPIGTILTTISDTNPSTYLGGTWIRYANGRTLVGVDENDDDFNTVQKTGGEKSHSLTAEENGKHSHSYQYANVNNLVRVEASSTYGRTAALNGQTGTSGEGKAHNNLQPFVTVYFWQRTA